MAMRWLLVRDAAATLGVSERTIRRRVQRQMLEARPGEAGRVEVCVPLPDAASVDLDAPPGGTDHPAAEPPAGFIAKAGRYSPLPASARPAQDDRRQAASASSSHDAATTEDVDAASQQQQQGDWPSYRPGKLMGDADADAPEDAVKRFQRLAGASMMLAQRHADDAHEQVVLARGEIVRLRKVCQYACAAAAGLAIVGVFLIGIVGHRASNANARLEAARERADVAEVAAQTADEQRQEVTRRLLDVQAALVEHIKDLDAEQAAALSRLMPDRDDAGDAWPGGERIPRSRR
ncbi:MAG: hypothetical protein WD316_00750 [Phycisphaeraceae bacterium]